MTVAGLLLPAVLLALGAAILLDARQDAWQQATLSATNLAATLERDIVRTVAVYDLSLQGAVDGLQQPGIEQVSPEIKQIAVFDRAASAEYLGSLLVLNAKGDIIADSTAIVPHALNFADRDYFTVHRDRSDIGLYLSLPFKSRLRNGDGSVAISRRLPTADGRFAGVVVGTMRLAYFQDLFGRLDLGPDGAVSLARMDGVLLSRQPAAQDRPDGEPTRASNLRRYATERSGVYVARAAADGVERMFAYRRVGDFSMMVVVSNSLDEIYAAWWRKAIGIGSILLVLSGTMAALSLLFRREMLRRLVAEEALMESAERLAVMAATDGLTGLANRRSFEADLVQEWKRAIRNRTPLALLILDADFFKAYNDRYGHQQGDEVLRKIATAVLTSIRRPGDCAARYGGEEFVALLPSTDLAGAMVIAGRICAAVAAYGEVHAGSPFGHVTVSIGVAATTPVKGQAESALVLRADMALYEAKRAGRGQSVAAPAEEPGVAAPPFRNEATLAG